VPVATCPDCPTSNIPVCVDHAFGLDLIPGMTAAIDQVINELDLMSPDRLGWIARTGGDR
jgi:hypothetical protein